MGGLFAKRERSYGATTQSNRVDNTVRSRGFQNISFESTRPTNAYSPPSLNYIDTALTPRPFQNTDERSPSYATSLSSRTNSVEDSEYDATYFPKVEYVYARSLAYIDLPFRRIIYECFPVHSYSEEYMEIKKLITNKHFLIRNIERIENPFLKKCYELKKKQKYEFSNVEEIRLFHGTNRVNVDEICKHNFNWRLNGSGTGHKFGKGVSFSCNAMYASNYSKDVGEKVMFLVNVLVGTACIGNANTVLPPYSYDTTLKNDSKIVVVKYEDNEFYPAYKINFYIHPDYVPLNKNGGMNRNRQKFYRRTQSQSYVYDDFYYDY